MKLITECNFHNGVINEVYRPDADNQHKLCKFKATFIQSDVLNKNGRVYPKSLMEMCVEKYKNDRMQEGRIRSYGELNHPEGVEIDLQNASHYISSLEWQDNNVVGVASLLNTPNGKIADAILREGLCLGVSTRGLGELGSTRGHMYEQYPGQIVTEYELICVDIVADPSAPEGWINGIMESKEWILSDGNLIEKQIQKIENAYKNIEKSLKSLPKKELEVYLIERAKKFLKEIR